jgi:serine/threonine-protein kinase PknK
VRDDVVPGVTDLELIATGGRSSVYRGTQAGSGRAVAVKILTLELDDPLRRAQFDNDSQALKALAKHPHVATVYDAGITAEGHPYVVMEYLPRSLAHLIAEEGRLRWQEAVALGTEVASALVAGQRRGVLHREVTPANILLATDDVPRLADFGLAGLVASPDAQTGSITGRLTHAAPEVIQGKTPDPRSDVYSLASTLHEALSGAPPFVRPGDETLVPVVSRILGENPPSLQRFGVPQDVEDVIHGAMAKDPIARPATAEIFAQQLLAAARHTGESTMELRITQRARASGAWDENNAVIGEEPTRDATPPPFSRARRPPPAHVRPGGHRRARRWRDRLGRRPERGRRLVIEARHHAGLRRRLGGHRHHRRPRHTHVGDLVPPGHRAGHDRS